jgi:hypothetical protein
MGLEQILSPLLASIIGGLVVAFANHFMTRRRETEKRLAELRIGHLIECWRKIEHASLIPEHSGPGVRNDAYDGMDDAVARITLLGTRREIEIANQVARELSNNNSSAVVDLLNELRASLRRELSLEEAPKMENVFFRMRRDEK